MIKFIESKQVGVLYHFTRIINIEEILALKKLKSIRGYVSFTRDYNFFKINKDVREFKDYCVRITIDGNKLSNKYSFMPFDFNGVTRKDKFLSLIKELPKNNQVIKEICRLYEGEVGEKSHCTVDLYINLDINTALSIKGQLNENREWNFNKEINCWMFGNYRIDKFYDLVTDIIINGLEHKIFILCDYPIDMKVNEGNHRIKIFEMLGYKTIPAQIKFFGHSEYNLSKYPDIEKKLKELSYG